MKKPISVTRISAKNLGTKLHCARGFSLLELLVATVVFSVVAGAAFSLYMKQEPLYVQQTGIAGLQISLSNAVGQMQLDLANAASGLIQGGDVAGWPIGVTITNNVSNSCNNAATFTYGAGCFDSMSVLMASPTVPGLHPTTNGSTTTGSLLAVPNPGDTAATDAAYFNTGDEVLLITNNNSGAQMDAVQLTSNGAASGNNVQLSFTPMNAGGTNSLPAPGDPLNITNTAIPGVLTDTYGPGTWIVKLNAVTYTVDYTTNPNDPTLMRVQGSGQRQALADQIIGFKIGAALYNGTTSTTDYNYDSAQYQAPNGNIIANDFALIRSVRISLIGRTTPNLDANYTFKNLFDNGPYQIQGISVVVNPRNLSMND
ncbi:MAG: prepilin-type N-terminal cleavage/methylation domain-containing protein [Candidatus Acidiferrales bacterium]